MFKKNRNKQCVLCTLKRVNDSKFCNDCVKIHNYIRCYGVNSTLTMLKVYNIQASAPSYNSN